MRSQERRKAVAPARERGSQAEKQRRRHNRKARQALPDFELGAGWHYLYLGTGDTITDLTTP